MNTTRPKPYRKHARLMYRLYRGGLAMLSHTKPLFLLALRILTREKRKIRGRVLAVNASLGGAENSTLTRDTLQKLIERSEGIALMDECMCRTVGGCGDYPRDVGCLLLGAAARNVHPGLGRQATGEEAMARVDRALGCGLIPMAMRLKSDAVLWSLSGSLLTICFCCPCHCLVLKGIGCR